MMGDTQPATPGYWAGWKLWRGGDCPFPSDTLVEVRFRMKRNGQHVQSRRPLQAHMWSWKHTGHTSDVVFYRVREAAISKAKGEV